MATINEILSHERNLLDDPEGQHPSLRHSLQTILNQIQSLYNQANNSNNAWSESEGDLTVVQGVDEYQLTLPLMGKPLFVFTKDDSNPSHIERPINVVELQNLLLTYQGPRDQAGLWPGYWDGSNHSARGMAFYQKDGVPGWFVRIRPVPQAQAVYRISYVQGNWVANAALGSEPILQEHHHLIAVRAALADLPRCRWGELSADAKDADAANAWARKTTALAKSLAAQEMQFRRDFEIYLSKLTRSRVTFRNSGFNY